MMSLSLKIDDSSISRALTSMSVGLLERLPFMQDKTQQCSWDSQREYNRSPREAGTTKTETKVIGTRTLRVVRC